MLETARSTRGMVVAPHHLAAEAGLAVLREGGNAIEAMIAAASTITVAYPHMNALGGDNFSYPFWRQLFGATASVPQFRFPGIRGTRISGAFTNT